MPYRTARTINEGHNAAREMRESTSNLVEATDLRELFEDLDEIRSMDAETIVNEVIHAAVGNIESLAKRYAPQATGELRSSIRSETGPAYGRVSASAPHAAFVEFGTWSHNVHDPQPGTYEIRPVDAQALRFEVGSQVVFAKKVNHPGIEPQPFMQPAVDEVVPELVDLLQARGVQLIVDGPS